MLERDVSPFNVDPRSIGACRNHFARQFAIEDVRTLSPLKLSIDRLLAATRQPAAQLRRLSDPNRLVDRHAHRAKPVDQTPEVFGVVAPTPGSALIYRTADLRGARCG